MSDPSHGSGPMLAYAFPEHIGRPAARVLQIAATMRGLADRGARVHFIVGQFSGLPTRLKELGLGPESGVAMAPVPMWQPGPGLRLPFSWHGPYHLACRSVLRRLAGQGAGWVLLRHLKLADHLLSRGLPKGMRMLFEAHELFSETAKEEGQPQAKVDALRKLEDRVLRGADRVAAISAPLARVVEQSFAPKAPVVVAHSGVDESFFAVPQDQRQDGLVVYAGGLGPWKGVDLLLEAVAKLPQARLAVLGGEPGSADWRRLEELATRLGLGERLTMRQRRDQAGVRELLSRGAVAVWPGTARQRIAAEFTSPLKLFEYLAAGCPVVAPRLPAALGVLSDGRDAALFAPDDAGSLAQAIEGLLADAARRQALTMAGRELGRSYTWRARADVLLRAMAEA